MAYTLLTGATGLLGRYLMRDLLLRDQPLAVLVRPSRRETAEQRVDAVLAHWENEWGRSLPRPVIFSGDLMQPMLGLGSTQRAWLCRNCDSVLHSAASLTFQEKDGEPWRTNVDGVRHVLDLCREVGIRVLEHVSTAYVCGLRTDRVCESELDEGQEFGNDYEKSKVAAERLVRSDDHLEAFTIFRPSIIVGDSNTGYTPTFHGFYTPLRVAAALLTTAGLDEALKVDYLKLLGLTGSERKNFVPVDWVSDAITSIRVRARPQNQTYMLATNRPVTAVRLRVVFEQSARKHNDRIEQYLDSRCDSGVAEDDGATKMSGLGTELFEKAYIEQFDVYRSYWRDDPDFDCSNTRAVLPDLPCPEVTDEMLHILCDYAIDVNFGFPRPRYDAPEFSARDWIRGRGKSPEGNDSAVSSAGGMPSSLAITVTGPGGGCWTIYDNGNDPFCYSEGRNHLTPEARMASSTFHDLVCGETSIDEAVAHGRIVLYGEQAGIRGLQSLIRVGRKGFEPSASDEKAL